MANQLWSSLKALVEPGTEVLEQDRRRIILLAWIQATLLLFMAFTLIFVLIVDTQKRLIFYTVLIGALFIVLLTAWILNKKGNYKLSAWLTILCTIIGPWMCIAFDPVIINGDDVPIMYISLSILTCSILLSSRATLLIALFQVIALFIILWVTPLASKINWPSLIAFIFSLSLLSVISNYLSQRDLKQINNQRKLLLQNEAYLRDLSVRDPLTTLFNRRYLDETLQRELRRAERKNYSIGVIMADVDHFKHINDSYGHMAGDAILQHIGTLLRSSVREADFACRLGGDEFFLVLPEATLEATADKAGQLLNLFNQKPLHIKNQMFNVTLCFGVAVYPDHGTDLNELLEAADKALYSAKNNGRARIAIAGQHIL